jgi:hypothetical protein
MTESKFRLLICLHLAFAGAAAVTAFVHEPYSAALAAAYANEPSTWLDDNIWALLAMALLLLIPWSAGIVGLFLFKRWGRSVSLGATLALLVICPFLGATLYSGLESALFEASTLCWGAALALAYYSTISAKFE